MEDVTGFAYSEAFWAITTVTVSFLAYHLMTSDAGRSNAVSTKAGASAEVSRILRQRFTGFIFFGVLPVVVSIFLFRFPIQGYGWNFMNPGGVIFWVLLLTPPILLINYLNASGKSNLDMYPQIRVSEWTPRILLVSAVSWITYLLAYEFMFRGFLLFSLYHSFGSQFAIAVNTSLYALVHLPKGMKETLGAIPLGIVLCILTLQTGNIWTAVLVHVIMAISNEWWSIRAHPNMKVISRS